MLLNPLIVFRHASWLSEFSQNVHGLSLISVNSVSFKNHWSTNNGQVEDPVCYVKRERFPNRIPLIPKLFVIEFIEVKSHY